MTNIPKTAHLELTSTRPDGYQEEITKQPVALDTPDALAGSSQANGTWESAAMSGAF